MSAPLVIEDDDQIRLSQLLALEEQGDPCNRRRPMGMPPVKWLLPAALMASLLAGGCGIPADQTPRDLQPSGFAYGPSAPAPNAFGPATERLYLVRNGKLVRVLRRVPAAPAPAQMVADLLAGPTTAEHQDDLVSALSTTAIGTVTVAQRRADVVVGEPSTPGARSDEVLAYGQIVCTLTSQGADVGTVSFTRAGQVLAVPRGDGSLSTDPLTIADYASLIDS